MSYMEEAKSIVQQSVGSERREGWMGEEWVDINWSQTGNVSMGGGHATVEENHQMEGGAPPPPHPALQTGQVPVLSKQYPSST